MLAVIHLMIWLKKRAERARLVFSALAVAMAASAAGELWLMRAETVEQYATAALWLHVPYWFVIASLVLFVRQSLRSGRAWLAWTIVAVRTFSLPLNFLSGRNLNLREVTGLRRIPFLGETVSIFEGVANPWMLFGQLSLLLLVVFIVDASASAWRRGDRRAALLFGGSTAFFSLSSLVSSVLIFWLFIPLPLMVSAFYMGVVVVMGLEITRDAVKSSRLAEELADSEARYRSIFEGAVEGIYRSTLEGKIVVANPAMATIIGYDSAEELQRSIADLGAQVWSAPEERAFFIKELKKRGAIWGYECRLRRKDGTDVWVLLNSRAFYGPDGRFAYADVFALDITERKQAEHEMDMLQGELIHLARVLTANELSASLAHEINQPLGAILNNAEAALILLSRPSGGQEAVPEIIEDIILDARRAGDVVRKVRGATIKTVPQFDRLPLNAMITEALKMFQNSLALNDITLHLDLAPGIPDILGDRVRLQQVLWNLVMNAVDAMKEAPQRILTVRSAMDGPDTVLVSVSDTGPGIPEAARATLYQPYVTSKKDGMGLGLSICLSIVKEHGGRIWEADNPGGGATFLFSLIVYQGDTPDIPLESGEG